MMARSENSWKEQFKNGSRIFGNLEFNSQIFGEKQMKKYITERKELLLKAMDEVDVLEAEKKKHIVPTPPLTHMVPDHDSKTMVERPTPADLSSYYCDEDGKHYDGKFYDKLNRALALSAVLQEELFESRQMLKQN